MAITIFGTSEFAVFLELLSTRMLLLSTARSLVYGLSQRFSRACHTT